MHTLSAKSITLISISLLCACSASQQKNAGTAEANLCKARATVKAMEQVDPSLVPVKDSPRAKVEAFEDSLCISLGDAGV